MSPQDILELHAPAKINLTLEILYRRKDGFHELKTVMQELDFGDLLHVEELEADRLEFSCDHPDLPTGEENLAYRAALLLRDCHGRGRGARLTLIKRIPIAAGLGGGSSNAAAVLKGLNVLWKLNLSMELLQELAAGLGSDVPFFLYGGTALAQGRGEQITPLPNLPPIPVLLVSLPGQTLSTPLVYRSLKWDKIKSGEKTGNFAQWLMEGQGMAKGNHVFTGQLYNFMINDLEAGAFALADNLPALKEELKLMGLMPLLSGSGPTVFALCPDFERLKVVENELSAKGYRVILTSFSRKSGFGL